MHPPADIPEHVFTTDELRAAKSCLKPNRSAGMDTVEAEFIRTMMGTALGFTFPLSLFCRCWSKLTMPTAFELARIVAVYKEKGDPGDADNYRPIALLKVCYNSTSLNLESLEARYRGPDTSVSIWISE